MNQSKIIKRGYIIMFVIAVIFSIYEMNTAPIMGMAIGTIAGPLCSVVCGILAIICMYALGW